MRGWILLVVTAAAFMAGPAAWAKAVPEPVAQMIDAAAAIDTGTLRTVVAVAKKTNPDCIAEIDARVAALARRATAEKTARLEEQGFFEGWTGKGEAGGFVSTGNTKEEGVVVNLGFNKETLRWSHDIDLGGDYKREDEETTKERYFAGYTGSRKLSRRLYAMGVLWAEQDRFVGLSSRFTEAVGLGYRVIDRPDLKLRFEAGPALRQADFVDRGEQNFVAARAAGYLSWRFSRGSEFTQLVRAYLQSHESSVVATSAVTSRLTETLSARASFEFRYESDPSIGRLETDTTTRATLVYSF